MLQPPSLPASLACISGTLQILRCLNLRDKTCYCVTQYSNSSLILLRYGLKIWTYQRVSHLVSRVTHQEDATLGEPTFIHCFTNTLKCSLECLHGRQAGYTGSPAHPGHPSACPLVIFLGKNTHAPRTPQDILACLRLLIRCPLSSLQSLKPIEELKISWSLLAKQE